MSIHDATITSAGTAPRRSVGPRLSRVRAASVMALGSAFATTFLTLAGAAVVTVRRRELHAWMEGSAATTAGLDVANDLIALSGLVFVAAFFLTGWWLVELRRVAEWYQPSGLQRRSSWWAFAGWVVPVVNLWFPYQLVADSSRALRSRVTNFWPWWIAWLLVGVGRVLDPTGGELATVADVDRWILAEQVNAVITLIAFVCWWRVVRGATSAASTAATVGP